MKTGTFGKSAILFSIVWALAGCGGGGSSQPSVDAGPGDVTTGDLPGQDLPTVPDNGPDFTPPDLVGGDEGDVGKPDGGGGDTTVIEGGFGWPCDDNGDCTDGFCVYGPNGKQCSRYCLNDCPSEWVCNQVGNPGQDVFFICLYSHVQLCSPCRTDADCHVADSAGSGYCIPDGDGTAGSFCATVCSDATPCPTGYECQDLSAQSGAGARGCVPSEGSCECGPYAIEEGGSTACSLTNALGTCYGERHCTDEGLTDCVGAMPAPEQCNGRDDDCDGDTDEETGGDVCYVENEAGRCQGIRVCTGGALLCDAPPPSVELCDGFDNDCDMVADEDYPDLDEDGLADCVDPDDDADGVNDGDDNCPVVANTDQADCNVDAIGDACQDDDDQDGVLDDTDCARCDPRVYPGNNELCDGVDNNCNGATDEGFTNTDGDALANCVDPDDDNDGILDDGDGSGISGDEPCLGGAFEDCDDNCPLVPNPDQLDLNNDAVGDACLGCQNECDGVGLMGCLSVGPIPWVCGWDADGDPCLDRIPQPACDLDELCENGLCAVGTCVHDCMTGDQGCLDDATPWTCAYGNDADPCLERVAGLPCGPLQVCDDGFCLGQCSDDCTAGETGCLDERTRWTCGEAGDGDDCLDFVPLERCEPGETCAGGICIVGCIDQCTAGQVGCLDATSPWYCGEADDGDACLDRIPGPECEGIEGCLDGACVQTCEHECEIGEAGCLDGDTYYTCGEAGDGDLCREPVPQPCAHGSDCTPTGCNTVCTDDCPVLGALGCTSDTQPYVCSQTDADECYETVALTPCGVDTACVDGLCLSTVVEIGQVIVGLGSTAVSGPTANYRTHVGMGLATPTGRMQPTGAGHEVDLGLYTSLRSR